MKKVLLIDSGSGGVNVLLECVKEAPYFDFLLFCDNNNIPYGNKTIEQIFEITQKNLKDIYQFFKFDIVVFACNTLTAMVIEKCRKMFPKIMFIGTEPAVKTALKKYKQQEILLLATAGTIEHSKLLRRYPKIHKQVIPELASEIDKHLDELGNLDELLSAKLKGRDEKAIVLGCTHYVAVKDRICNILPNSEIFSGENGVARRLKAFADESRTNYQVQIITSKMGDFKAKLLYYFNKKSEE